MELERNYQRSRADLDFDQAKICSYGAGGQTIIAAAAAMTDTPTWLLGAAVSAIFAGVAVGCFAEGIKHVAASVQPDSLLRRAVEQMEAEQPSSLIEAAEPDGRIAPARAASISQS